MVTLKGLFTGKDAAQKPQEAAPTLTPEEKVNAAAIAYKEKYVGYYGQPHNDKPAANEWLATSPIAVAHRELKNAIAELKLPATEAKNLLSDLEREAVREAKKALGNGSSHTSRELDRRDNGALQESAVQYVK